MMSTGLQMALILVQLLVYVGIGWRLIRAPRRYWDSEHRRSYTPARRDHEPDDSTLNRYRARGVAALVVMVPMTVGFLGFIAHMTVDTSSARSAARQAVADLRSKEFFLVPSADDVRQAVQDANPFTRFRVAGGGQYEITNALGRGPVCLTVDFDLRGLRSGLALPGFERSAFEGSEFRSRIDDGRC